MTNVSTFPGRPPSSSQPTIQPVQPIPDIPAKTILDYLDATGLSAELTEAEKTQFVSVCQAFGLNPFKREVYATVYGEGSYRRFSVIVGYETYLKRADRSGKLDGWSSRIEGSGDDMRAIVEIHRKDWTEPLIHEVFFIEVIQKKKDGSPTSFWSKMPRFQLKKVAISQGFRLAFPDELGGLPYDASELPDAEVLVPATTVSPIPEARASTIPMPTPSKPAVAAQRPGLPIEPKPVMVERSVAPPSEPVPIRFIGYQDQYPDEPQNALLRRLETYLDNNFEAFGEKHRDWVFEKAKHSRDREGVLKMLSYAQKVVKNVGAVAGASA
jgi:phage recombination protein Bet